MAWLVLVISAVFEAVWATALGKTDHFSNTSATLVFIAALAVSMIGLGWAAKFISIGTAYAIWTGLGAALTVSYAALTGDEAVSVAKIVFLAGIIVAVVGLKLIPAESKRGSLDRR